MVLLRSTKGAPLTGADHDGNLRQRGWRTLGDLLESQEAFATGALLYAGGCVYRVLAGNATFWHFETAAGQKLELVPSSRGFLFQGIPQERWPVVWLGDAARSVAITYLPGILTENYQMGRAPLHGQGAGMSSGLVTQAVLYAGVNIDPEIKDGNGGAGAVYNATLVSGNPAIPTFWNRERHFQPMKNVSFHGQKDEGVPHFSLRLALYARITGLYFPDGGFGIDASQESNIPDLGFGSYYGVNDCWFRQVFYKGSGCMMVLHGWNHAREFYCEREDASGPAFVDRLPGVPPLGAAGHQISQTMFFYETVSPTAEPYYIYHNVAAMSGRLINSTFRVEIPPENAGDFEAAHLGARYRSIRENVFDFPSGRKALAISSGLSNGAFSLVGSHWPTGQEPIFTFGGRDIATESNTGAANTRRYYIRDRKHGITRQYFAKSHIWATYTADDTVIDLRAGKHHCITATPSSDLTVSDTDRWRGVSFRIHFEVETILRNASFGLAKGADAVVPAGIVLSFTVDHAGAVREVGRSSIAFGSPS
jgi:hypothetical protein